MNNETPGKRNQCVVSCLVGTVMFLGMMAVFLYPMFAKERHVHAKMNCIDHLKQISSAISMYQSDWDDCRPQLHSNHLRVQKGKGWFDLVAPYAPNKYAIAECPEVKGRLTYSFNRRLSGMPDKKITCPLQDVLLVFESVNGLPENNNLNGASICRPSSGKPPIPGSYISWPKNAWRLSNDWPIWASPNHEDVTIVVMADGHAKVLRTGYISNEPSSEPSLSPK